MLLKLARDKGFERLVKMEKGKNTERINMITARHQSSLKFSFSQVNIHQSTTGQAATWEVQSCENTNIYSVHNCPNNCSIRCQECNICVHMFLCNCANALIKSSICKLAHLVASFQSQKVQLIHHFLQQTQWIIHVHIPLKCKEIKHYFAR